MSAAATSWRSSCTYQSHSLISSPIFPHHHIQILALLRELWSTNAPTAPGLSPTTTLMRTTHFWTTLISSSISLVSDVICQDTKDLVSVRPVSTCVWSILCIVYLWTIVG